MSQTRTTAADLARLLNDADSPVYVLDEDRKIVFCNAACARWTHVAAGELLDRQCVYHAPTNADDLSDVAAGLCPPPKVFAGHAQAGMVTCRAPNGRRVYRRGFFLPLGDGADESAPVVAVLEPADCPAPTTPASEASIEEALHEHVRRFRQEMLGRYGASSLIGDSPAIARVRAQVELASHSMANVLILGPLGSGKDHVAKAIHYGQSRPGQLVPQDCSLLEPAMLRATLKGLRLMHAGKDASTTLLLSDVDQLPEVAQAELAELLRAGTLGMRLIATATKSPLTLAAERCFSHELACGLATFVIELPPLAQRLEDVPLLAQALLEEANATNLKQLGGFTSEALDQLVAHPWRRNVDELADAVREAHQRAQRGEVTARDLPRSIHQTADATAHPARHDDAIELEEFLARVERELIARALARAKGNKSKAAKLLGLTRPRLYRRLVQLGLEPAGDGGEE